MVKLAMALVFMGGWARSLSVTDILELPNDDLISVSGGIYWCTTLNKTENKSISFTSFEHIDPYYDSENWRWRRFGFGGGDYQTPIFSRKPGSNVGIPVGTISTKFYRVPYWSLAIPLTPLSAFLLLSKPRKSTPKKNDEPIAAERTCSGTVLSLKSETSISQGTTSASDSSE